RQSCRLANRETAPPAEKDQGKGGIVNQVGFRRLFDAVSRRDVADLVRHHARQLGFVVGRFDHTAIDVEEAARQRKSVDLVRVYHLDRERRLGVRVQRNVLSHTVDVLGDQRIGDELRFPVNLGGELAAESRLFIERVEIYLAFVDVPLADQLWVVLLVQRLPLRLRKRRRCGQGKQDRKRNRSA